MTNNILHNWVSLADTCLDEPNLKVTSIKRKPTRDKIERKGVETKAVERKKFHNPTLTITMEAVVTALSGLGSLGVGSAVSAGLTNFNTTVWRGHNSSDGTLTLDDVEDSAGVDEDEDLTSTFTFVHSPFVD